MQVNLFSWKPKIQSSRFQEPQIQAQDFFQWDSTYKILVLKGHIYRGKPSLPPPFLKTSFMSPCEKHKKPIELWTRAGSGGTHLQSQLLRRQRSEGL
jgi:hypothetical protein